jgi:signal peptidase I
MPRPEHLDIVFDAAMDFAQSGSVAIRIRGDCMQPALTDGEMVSVRRTRFLLPGDVVVFRNTSTLVAHRVIGWAPIGSRLGYVTRGDQCERHDGIVARERVVGRVETPVGPGQRLAALLAFTRLILTRLRRSR